MIDIIIAVLIMLLMLWVLWIAGSVVGVFIWVGALVWVVKKHRGDAK